MSTDKCVKSVSEKSFQPALRIIRAGHRCACALAGVSCGRARRAARTTDLRSRPLRSGHGYSGNESFQKETIRVRFLSRASLIWNKNLADKSVEIKLQF